MMRTLGNAQGDPGLQAQRTVLAWNRTVVVSIANVLMALRAAYLVQAWTLVFVSVALLLASACLLVVGSRRRSVLIDGRSTAASSARAVAGVAVTALLACVVGAASTLALALQ